MTSFSTLPATWIKGRFSRRTILVGAAASIPAVAGAAALPLTAVPQVAPASGLALTPDERITAAIDEIKAAFWEKWPDAPLRIIDTDNIDSGLVLVVSHCRDDNPGEVRHERTGLARKGDAS